MEAEKLRLIAKLREAFGSKTQTLGLNMAASVANNQLPWWVALLSPLSSGYTDQYAGMRSVLNGDNPAYASGVEVVSKFPILRDTPDPDLLALVSRYPATACAVMVTDIGAAIHNDVTLLVDQEIASILIYEKNIHVSQEIRNALDSETSAILSLSADAQNLLGDAKQSLAEAENYISDLGAQQLSDQEKLKVDIDERIAGFDEAMRGVVKAFEQERLLQSAVDLWDGRSKTNCISFWASAVAFSVIIIAFTAGLGAIWYKYGVAIWPEIKDNHFLVTALIVSPILAIALLLRFILRFSQQSLASWQDAIYRSAVADTYSRMLAKNHEMLPSERGYALYSLFRAAPGAAADEINPPNWLEVLSGKPS